MINSPMVSIDTNILLRHLLQDHDTHSPRASALLLAVRLGQRTIYCPATAIFVTIHILHGRVGLPRADIAWALSNLIALPNFVMADEDAILNALAFWNQQSPLDFPDCYHLTLTESLGMSEIYTFDRKMDRYPGVTRIEP